MHEIRLRDTPQDAWVEQDVNAYLNQALWVMYYGMLLYVLDHGTVPTDLELLVDDGYLSRWPRNPLREWRKMLVLDIEDGYWPCDLCLQVCPEEFYSYVGTDVGPCSFELCVYGPKESSMPFGPLSPLIDNSDWALVPPDAVIMAGYFREPAKRDQEEAND